MDYLSGLMLDDGSARRMRRHDEAVDEPKSFRSVFFHRSLTVAALWTMPKQSRVRKQAAGDDAASTFS